MTAASTGKKTGYHHGNLREALLEAAMEALQTEGLDSLSLRNLARRVGVSATAVYGHFADKTALLVELRTQGFRLLTQYLQHAYDHTDDTEQRVRELGHAYMRFGRENPHLFDVLFTWVPDINRITPECIAEGNNSESLLRRALIEMLTGIQLPPNEQFAAMASFSAWSLVHGITLLLKSGAIEGAVYCGKLPENFSAQHPASQQSQVIDQLLTIEIEGLKAVARQRGQ